MLKVLASAIFALVLASSSINAAPNVVLNLGANWFSAGSNGPSVAQTSKGTVVTYAGDWKQAGVWLGKEKAVHRKSHYRD